MLILGIETSCDDTSVALVKADRGGFRIIKQKTASQIEVHKKYGGVVPEVAGRKHAENILPVIEEVMSNQKKPDAIAVTSGPGLITGLLVGVEAAKTLSYLWNVPLVGVNHLEGHVHSVEVESKKYKVESKISYPALALIASGGHTELILIKKQGKYKRIGATKDDAAGEAFDKVAKLLGFDYPGGPHISKMAEKGNPEAIKFPRPLLAGRSSKSEGGLNKDNFDFSFSGLKTSALYWLRDNAKKCKTGYGLRVTGLQDFCASFEQAIIDVLVGKTVKAAQKYNPKTIILSGGVSANKKLRKTMEKMIKQEFPDSIFQIPNSKYSMDNAAMIAVAGYYHAIKKDFTPWKKLKADPMWKLAC